MLNKIVLSIALFQLLIVAIMADSCNLYFETTRSDRDGPNFVQSGVCFPFNHIGLTFHDAWIEGIPVGAGYLKFYGGHICDPEKLVTEGTSPVNLRQGESIGSVFVQSYALFKDVISKMEHDHSAVMLSDLRVNFLEFLLVTLRSSSCCI